MPQPELPISFASHVDWLKQALPAFRYGEIGLVFTLRDGVIVRARRVFHQTFKANGCEEAIPIPEERDY